MPYWDDPEKIAEVDRNIEQNCKDSEYKSDDAYKRGLDGWEIDDQIRFLNTRLHYARESRRKSEVGRKFRPLAFHSQTHYCDDQYFHFEGEILKVRDDGVLAQIYHYPAAMHGKEVVEGECFVPFGQFLVLNELPQGFFN